MNKYEIINNENYINKNLFIKGNIYDITFVDKNDNIKNTYKYCLCVAVFDDKVIFHAVQNNRLQRLEISVKDLKLCHIINVSEAYEDIRKVKKPDGLIGYDIYKLSHKGNNIYTLNFPNNKKYLVCPENFDFYTLEYLLNLSLKNITKYLDDKKIKYKIIDEEMLNDIDIDNLFNINKNIGGYIVGISFSKTISNDRKLYYFNIGTNQVYVILSEFYYDRALYDLLYFKKVYSKEELESLIIKELKNDDLKIEVYTNYSDIIF